MRSLLIFADMLGGEYMNICNEKAKKLKIDTFLQKIGGTIFQNCYTPAPDTGRSSACMWTGCYPRSNGCNHRLKYPRYFLNDELNTVWKMLDKSKYAVNIFASHDVLVDGLIPVQENYHLFTDGIDEFLNNAQLDNDTFNLLYLPDIHTVMNVLDYTLEAYEIGTNEFLAVLEKIFDYYVEQELFDYIIIFSDHGFRLWDVEKERILDKDRTHTYMQLWKKGDSSVRYDKVLRSNLDLFPTVCGLEGWTITGIIDGISLENENGHEFILMEDHNSFDTEVGQGIATWGVITSSGVHHWIDVEGNWIYECADETFDTEYYARIVNEALCDYQESRELFLYAKIYLSHVGDYCRNSVGEKLEKQYFFDMLDVVRGKSIVIYGAGTVGKGYYEQISKIEDITITAWVDINYKNMNKSNYPMCIEGIGCILKAKFDYLIISLNDPVTAELVKKMLIQIGIEDNRILYCSPKSRLIKSDASGELWEGK